MKAKETNFAAAFAEIFDSIFKAVPKPRLVQIDGFWVCRTPDGAVGYGVNPRQAYGAWRARKGLS